MRLAPLLLVALALAVGAVTVLAWRGAGTAARAELEERGRALVPVAVAALQESRTRAEEAVERERLRLLSVARRARTELAQPLGPARDRMQRLLDEERVGRLVLLHKGGAEALVLERASGWLMGNPDAQFAPGSTLEERGAIEGLLPSGTEEASRGLTLNAFATAHDILAAVRTKDGGALLLSASADHLAEAQRGSGALSVLERLEGLPDVRGVVLRAGPEVALSAGLEPRPRDLRFAETLPGSGEQALELTLVLSTERVDAIVAEERARLLLYGALAAGAALLAAFLLWRRDRAEALRRARTEAAEREQQRLAEMGVLTGLFVHEVSNPLNALGLQLEGVKRAAGGAGAEEVARVKATLARVRQSLESFLSVATPLEGREGERYDVARLERTLADLRHEGPAATLALEVAPGARDLAVAARVPVLDQALRNLIRNALQAAPPGSTVRLAWEASAGGVALVVSDLGAGFPAQVLESGGALGVSGRREGHGLGLFLARRIVEGLGGRLELTNPKDGGAQVRAWLPVAPRQREAT